MFLMRGTDLGPNSEEKTRQPDEIAGNAGRLEGGDWITLC